MDNNQMIAVVECFLHHRTGINYKLKTNIKMKKSIRIINGIKVFIICFVMRSFWADMANSHDFFVRKSQFYVLGNWKIYVKDVNAIIKYERQYLEAYIKFMWYCYTDFVRGINYA